MTPRKTNVYVDGFNLYYNSVKNTPYKWLDISKLVSGIFPKNTINRIRYFSAKVKARPDDPQKPQRQEIYFRALSTISNLSIHLGHFVSWPRMMPLASNANHNCVEVIYTEEKGSDVNLATYLLLDAFKKDCEVAIVVSNDSDLAEPIRIVKSELKLPVGILNPQKDSSMVARELRQLAAFYRPITISDLSRCQFPITMTDNVGSFTKPSTW
ncbi:MAG: NYN domain-containing protein [Chloroflexi bacterium]|nr:NYN domain-containing protein [Chloroflexota bacterium]